MTRSAQVNEYGNAAFRTRRRAAIFRFSTDGRTLLALDWFGLQYGDPTWFDVVDTTTGAVIAGPEVTALATSADVVAVAGTAQPGVVTLLALPDLAPRAEITVGGQVTRLALGGGTLVAAGPGMLLVHTEAAVHRIALSADPSCLAVSTDGTTVVVGTDRGRGGNVLVVDTATGVVRHTLTGPRAPVTSVAVSAVHDVVTAAAGPRVFAWTPSARKPRALALWSSGGDSAVVAGITSAGQVIAHSPRGLTVSLDPAAASIVWSVDSYGPALVAGDRVLSVRFSDVREHDPDTGAVRHTWTIPGFADALAVWGDTAVVSNGSSRPVLLRAGAAGPALLGSGHDRKITGMSFDGDRFATLAADRRICVWQRGRTEPLHTIDTGEWVVERHPESVLLTGTTLYAGPGNVVQRWELGEGEPRACSARLKDDVAVIHSLPDRGLLLVGSENTRRTYGMFYLMDPQTLEIRQETRSTLVRGRVTYTPGAGVFHLHWSHGRRTIDLASLDSVSEQRVSSDDYSRSAHLTPDHDLLVETKADTLYVTDLSTGEYLHKAVPIPQLTGSPAMSAHGAFVTPHADGLRLWDVRAATVVRLLPLLKVDDAMALHWFPADDGVLVCYDSGACHEVRL